MDITQIDEKWIDLTKYKVFKKTIVAVSNTGKYRRSNGTEGILSIRQRVSYKGELERCSHIIADHFLITVKRPDQTYVDHITHNPTEYYVNDIRNLRYCTHKENLNFDEARENNSKAHRGEKSSMYGRKGEMHPMYGRTGDKCSRWKGDDVGPSGAYKRAKKLYNAGNITEEEFKQFKDAKRKYHLQRRMARKVSEPS